MFLYLGETQDFEQLRKHPLANFSRIPCHVVLVNIAGFNVTKKTFKILLWDLLLKYHSCHSVLTV